MASKLRNVPTAKFAGGKKELSHMYWLCDIGGANAGMRGNHLQEGLI